MQEVREMMKSPGKFILSFLICMLAVSSLVMAGTTGKIKGVVLDKETGEPLPGASIQIMGTTQGALSDIDGDYMISLVPPGLYTLRFTIMGYQTVEVENVEVVTDIPTDQNVEMESAVTDLDLVIRVTAKPKGIDKHVTNARTTIGRETIEKLPVQNVDQLLQQTAGVVTSNEGEIIIRGGRAGEVAYIVDGVQIDDPLGGEGPVNLGLSLTSGSIQEINIIKDGFDPEYGNALSGIIQITTQTGSPEKTNMTMQYITDDFGNTDLNKFSENYDNVYFMLSGPDPLLKNRILPALGLNFLEDKEVTYFLFAEVRKTNTAYSYDEYASPTTTMKYSSFNLFGIDIPERQYNDYNLNANLLMKPLNNMKLVFSYKTSVNRQTSFAMNEWQYRYTPNTAPVGETKWQSYSVELTHQLSKNMHYYFKASYYNRDVFWRPGDPNNPGNGLNPDDFLRYNEFERFDDRNGNGVYDPPEPVVNLFPDSMLYGRDLSSPGMTQNFYFGFAHQPNVFNAQGGYSYWSDFRFNSGNRVEFEPFADLDGNGFWYPGDYLYDTDGDGQFDYDRRDIIDSHEQEPYIDGDQSLGEPFTDVNNNGIYDEGIDIFVMSEDPELNQDLDRNSSYTPPFNFLWSPGIPFIDRNGNGIFDGQNFQYDPGEPFTDVNGNGTYDYGGSSNFLNIGNFESETVWHHRRIQQYTIEGRLYRQLGNHEIKAGAAFKQEYLVKQDIRSLEQPYNGRDDRGLYPGIGELRDFYEYSPLSGSFYIRDNLEYGSMISSLGFRYDYFIQTEGLEEVARNDDLGSGIIYGDRTRFSPRIGFSYPISDKAKIHFNYGHFYQLPSYTYMYGRNTASASANDVIGNYNLDYVKTIQYSFGVKYAMTEDYTIDVSGYFKDEFDKVNSTNVRLGGGALVVQRYENRDYGRSRGFEITIEKRGGRLINGEVNYTYAFAYGKQSQTRTTYFEDFYLSRESLSEKPLDNDVRHQFNCGVQLVIPETMKPRLFGVRIPNGWTFAVQGSFETGRPFTPGDQYPNLTVESGLDIQENSLRTPSRINFDVRFEKYFSLISFNWRFIVWIDNLLDNRNARGVYGDTGRADTRQTDGYNVTGGTEYDMDPYNWAYGRQIKVGLQVSI
jgi:outer membrane receptor protein involved in Fe transport